MTRSLSREREEIAHFEHRGNERLDGRWDAIDDGPRDPDRVVLNGGADLGRPVLQHGFICSRDWCGADGGDAVRERVHVQAEHPSSLRELMPDRPIPRGNRAGYRHNPCVSPAYRLAGVQCC